MTVVDDDLTRNGKVIPTEVKVGDKVLLPSYGGQSIKVGEEVSSFQSIRLYTPFFFFFSTFIDSRPKKES